MYYEREIMYHFDNWDIWDLFKVKEPPILLKEKPDRNIRFWGKGVTTKIFGKKPSNCSQWRHFASPSQSQLMRIPPTKATLSLQFGFWQYVPKICMQRWNWSSTYVNYLSLTFSKCWLSSWLLRVCRFPLLVKPKPARKIMPWRRDLDV